MKHTKEPWNVKDITAMYSVIEPFIVANGQYIPIENARRIVACVNKLAGIPTNCIEDDGFNHTSIDNLRLQEQVKQLERQNAGLVEALKRSHEHMQLYMSGFYQEGQNVFDANKKALTESMGVV